MFNVSVCMYIERPILPSAGVCAQPKKFSRSRNLSTPSAVRNRMHSVDELEYVHGVNCHRTKRRSRCMYRENFHCTYPQRLVALREFSRNVTPSVGGSGFLDTPRQRHRRSGGGANGVDAGVAPPFSEWGVQTMLRAE